MLFCSDNDRQTNKDTKTIVNNCTGALPGEMNLVLQARKIENVALKGSRHELLGKNRSSG